MLSEKTSKYMDFGSAINAMKNNKKITNKDIDGVLGISWGTINVFDKETYGFKSNYETTAKDLVRDDWYIYHEVEYYNFSEVLTLLKTGKRLKYDTWNKDEYICMVDDNINIKRDGALKIYIPTDKEILSNRWCIV